MSHWTYLNGSINVDFSHHDFCSAESAKLYLEWVVAEVMKQCSITGSERDAEISVHIGHRTGFIGDGDYSRDTYSQGWLQLRGSFRDRYVERTNNETVAFINKLAEYVDILHIVIDVNDGGICGDTNGTHTLISSVKHEGVETIYINLETLQNSNYDAIYKERMRHLDDFKSAYCTKERMVDFINTLNLMPFKIWEAVMSSFPIDRRIEWDYSDDYIEMLISNGLPIPELDSEYVAKIRERVTHEKE